MMIRSLPEKTRERIRNLENYVETHVLDENNFRCRNFQQCRASRAEFPFYEGQLPYIGKHYDLELDSRPVRLLFVGQEYGHGPARVTLKERSEMILRSARVDFRSKRRNPHMKGTASTLRLLLRREPGIDSEGERLFEDAHIFDGFALVNYLLCSAIREKRDYSHENFKGAEKGFSSGLMRRNCGEHFRRTIEILEPTLILVQGQAVRKWIADSLEMPEPGEVFEQVEIRGEKVDVLTFDHPSAGGKSGYWGGSPRSRYLNEVVRPAIRDYWQNNSLR